MNNLLKIWKEDKPVINAWLSIPNSFTAEAFGRMGWDAITIDMQHGQTDYSASLPMLQAFSSSQSTPMVRVPWSEPGVIMRMQERKLLSHFATPHIENDIIDMDEKKIEVKKYFNPLFIQFNNFSLFNTFYKKYKSSTDE